MYLIVGLGNKGKKYENTRHNLGFMVVDQIATDGGMSWKDQCNAKVATGVIARKTALFVKPQQFMNLSGESVRCLMSYYHLTAADLVVIHDELDLPLSELRVKKGGSAAGHNGVQNIIDCIGTDDFVRVRLGMRTERVDDGYRSGEAILPADEFVLQKFSAEEIPEVVKIVAEAIKKLEVLVQGETA